jgi:hypothetical protein
MKFNLKTFPKRKKETVIDPINGVKIESIVIPSLGDYESWVESFEEEIRRVIDALAVYPIDEYDMGRLNALMNVLGDEK